MESGGFGCGFKHKRDVNRSVFRQRMLGQCGGDGLV